jgi:hypothetical protein
MWLVRSEAQLQQQRDPEMISKVVCPENSKQ